MFKKERTFLKSKSEYYKVAKGEFDFKTISKEDLLLLRKKVIRNRIIDEIKSWTILSVILILSIGFGIYLSNILKKEEIIHIQNAEQIYIAKNSDKYKDYIDKGDKWIEKKNWNNAIYRYNQAKELFPNEFDINYRLALAYSYRCDFEKIDCEKGKKLTNQLLKQFPKNSDLKKLQIVFDKK